MFSSRYHREAGVGGEGNQGRGGTNPPRLRFLPQTASPGRDSPVDRMHSFHSQETRPTHYPAPEYKGRREEASHLRGVQPH